MLLLFAPRRVHAQDEAPQLHLDNGLKRQYVDFKLVKNLIVVPMMVNGNGPYNFVVDTGVGLFIITDSTLVGKMTNLRMIKITGLGEGQAVDAWTTNSVSVRIGEHIGGNLPAAILKKDAFNLSNYTGMPIHGLLGYELFNSFVVRIDYQQKLLTMYRPDKTRNIRKGYRLPLIIEEHKPYIMAEVAQEKDRVPVKLIIDSGAGHPVSLETTPGGAVHEPAKRISANLGVGLSGPISGSIGRVNELRLGKYSLKNVIAAFPNERDVQRKVLGVKRDGNLGNNVLKRFSVLFDYSRQSLYIRPSAGYNEPFEHDMSGLELSTAGPDFMHVYITRVEPGSAGEAAGLLPDDEILAINFKAVKNMAFDEVDELFHSRDDRSFVLEILPRDSKTPARVILTLKRRI